MQLDPRLRGDDEEDREGSSRAAKIPGPEEWRKSANAMNRVDESAFTLLRLKLVQAQCLVALRRGSR